MLAEDDMLLSNVGLLKNELVGSIENPYLPSDFWNLNSTQNGPSFLTHSSIVNDGITVACITAKPLTVQGGKDTVASQRQ